MTSTIAEEPTLQSAPESPETTSSDQDLVDAYRTPETEQALSGQGKKEQIAQELWKQDKRYGTFFKSPDDVYNLYRGLEKETTPLKQRVAEFERKQAENEARMKSLTETNSKAEQLLRLTEFLDANPEYGQRIQQALKEIEKEVRRNEFGVDVPDHIVDRLNKVGVLEGRLQEFEQKQEIGKISSEIEIEAEKVAEFAKEHKLEYNEAEFLNYCKTNGIAPKYIQDVFIRQSLPHILKAKEAAGEQKTLKNIEKNNRGALPSATRQPIKPAKGDESWNEALTAAFRK